MMPGMQVVSREQILSVLARVVGTDRVEESPDLRLYEERLLDSLRTVELLLALEETFGITIPPSDVDTDAWSTPASLVADIERRLA